MTGPRKVEGPPYAEPRFGRRSRERSTGGGSGREAPFSASRPWSRVDRGHEGTRGKQEARRASGGMVIGRGRRPSSYLVRIHRGAVLLRASLQTCLAATPLRSAHPSPQPDGELASLSFQPCSAHEKGATRAGRPLITVSQELRVLHLTSSLRNHRRHVRPGNPRRTCRRYRSARWLSSRPHRRRRQLPPRDRRTHRTNCHPVFGMVPCAPVTVPFEMLWAATLVALRSTLRFTLKLRSSPS